MRTVPLLPPQPECTACDLHNQGPSLPKSVGVPTLHLNPPYSPDIPIVFLVGQNPGYEEDQCGLPFVGRSGKLLRTVYLDGISLPRRANVFLSNAVRCHTLANDPPRTRHYRDCCHHWRADLSALSALPSPLHCLVLLGGGATTHGYRYLLNSSSISLAKSFSLNGNVHAICDTPWHVFSTYHPAAVLRNPNHINAVHGHNQLLSDCLDGTMASPSSPRIVPPRPPETT